MIDHPINVFLHRSGGLALVAALSAFTLIGCVNQHDARLNHQNIGAAKLIITTEGLPAPVYEAAADIGKNSEVLTRALGVPSDPEPYSSETSADARDKSNARHDAEDAAWEWGKGFLGGLPYVGSLFLGGLALFTTRRKKMLEGAVDTLIGAIGTGKQQTDIKQQIAKAANPEIEERVRQRKEAVVQSPDKTA